MVEKKGTSNFILPSAVKVIVEQDCESRSIFSVVRHGVVPSFRILR